MYIYSSHFSSVCVFHVCLNKILPSPTWTTEVKRLNIPEEYHYFLPASRYKGIPHLKEGCKQCWIFPNHQ